MSSPAHDRSTSRTLATRWIATLDDRPFCPTPERLAWVAGGDLVEGEARARRLPMAAARYAALFADHVTQDMAAEGGPGAYVRIWLCARRAFIDSMSAVTPAAPPDAGVASWENEGGAALGASTSGVTQPTDRPACRRSSRDGERYVIVGSKGGAPTHPGWYFNILANPIVMVEVGGEAFEARAISTAGAERDRLFSAHAAANPRFEAYQQRTTRVLPVVVLERLS